MRTIRTLNHAALTCDHEVKTARVALAAAVEGGAQACQLANLLNDLAKAEGRLGAILQAVQLDARNCTPDAIRNRLARVMLAGADDTWSGRTNDVRRARHDGAREATAEVLDYLTAQADATV